MPRDAIDSPVTLYHAQPYGHHDPMRRPVRPEIFVDVTGVHAEKTAMLAEHKSQKQWLDESQGLDSYLHTMKDLDAQAGRMSGRYALAEGFHRHLHLGFCEADDDPLVEALGEHCFVEDAAGGGG